MCTFCPKSFEILHPLDGKFMCGKKSQANEEQQGFSHYMNLLEKPYTCATPSCEVKEDMAIPEEERRSILRWTILPFNFIRGFCGPWMLNLRRG
jgi:hypothetical protein